MTTSLGVDNCFLILLTGLQEVDLCSRLELAPQEVLRDYTIPLGSDEYDLIKDRERGVLYKG